MDNATDAKSRLLLAALIVAIAASLYLTYNRTIVDRDFEMVWSEDIATEE